MEIDITRLLALIEEMPAYRRLVNELARKDGETNAAVLDAAKPYFIAALYRHLQRPMLVVTAQSENSQKFYEQLSVWLGTGPVKLLPEPESLPYERLPANGTAEMERLQVLSALSGVSGNGATAPSLVVASAAGLMPKVPAHRDFTAATHTIKTGMEIEPLQLLGRWLDMGYKREDMVEVPGTMSQRGGIIDIYPVNSDLPVRLEFFGNTIDSIRSFDPSNQRSLQAVSPVSITPATEILPTLANNKMELEPLLDSLDLSNCSDEVQQQFRQELTMLLHKESVSNHEFYAPLFNRDSVFSYLPGNGLLILDEPQNLGQTIADLDEKAGELRQEQIERGELPRNFPRPYFTWAEMEPLTGNRSCVRLTAWDTDETAPNRLGFTPAPRYGGQLPTFTRKVKEMLGEGQRVIIVSHQASRLSELLDEEDVIAPPLAEIKEIPPPGSLTLVPGLLAGGWIMNGNTCLLSDAEIFGFIKQRRLMKKHPVPRHKLFVDMVPGDYVVHVDHGIARFAGVTKMNVAGLEKEYLLLEYAAGDKLYVPLDQIDRVNRYIGSGEQSPTLSRLGTQEWLHTKERVEKSVADMAEELLTLYATREVVPGYAYSPDTVWQQEMEGSFPYVETPDQIDVQAQVKEDMQKVKPMDRLVCGDVGYGKTEVAIRAAFKAVMDGKQVVVLVPTTVLAEQHFTTFTERLKAFPVKIEVLSRFRSGKEQQKIIEGLASGGVDICIGTHRLLQKDVAFKDLGLLIIDEEQRFGVAHKEYLKKMRQQVDVLTLSATPIPRTLHMSLVGVRDMSVMETPPEERLPVKTYVAEYNERLVREAVLRELERDGQVFFLHNRVQSIAWIASQLRALVPEARVSIGHGQMPEEQLEKVMADFAQGKSDILVCTSIIESGLDMPNVNTLIVNQADKFGLTQLYQLRGRVGRGAHQAYAYFLYEKGKHLKPVAEKRLKTIFEATELGSGFSIAMKDLEIRGAGTLLGAHQSGHISAVGFSLYCQLLGQAVDAQKARLAGVPQEKREKRLPLPTVDLPLPAYIPEDYITDLNTRLGLYQKLVRLDKVAQVENLAQEFRDRFGTLPREVENLLYAVRIKVLAAAAGIESVTTEEGEIVIRRFEGMEFNRQKLESFFKVLRVPASGFSLGMKQLRLNPKRLGKDWQKLLEEVIKRLG